MSRFSHKPRLLSKHFWNIDFNQHRLLSDELWLLWLEWLSAYSIKIKDEFHHCSLERLRFLSWCLIPTKIFDYFFFLCPIDYSMKFRVFLLSFQYVILYYRTNIHLLRLLRLKITHNIDVIWIVRMTNQCTVYIVSRGNYFQ